jgi:DNA-cytosine methyltransferase
MNVLSLFDGMSCGRIALERAGIPVTNYFASEIDPYAIKVSKANWPDIVHIGDVTKVRLNPYYGDTVIHYGEAGDFVFDGKIDLIIGGSPCQGFSFAGKQLNFEDPRSKLFFEFVRILNSNILENEGTLFFLENVNMAKKYQDVISEILGVKPIRINSNLVSAQNRDRLYWTNIPNIEQPKDTECLLPSILESGVVDRDKSFCIDANYWKGTSLEQYLLKSRRQIVFTERRTEEAKKIRSEYMKIHKRDFSPRRAKELVAREDDKSNCLTTSLTKEHILLDEQNQFRKLTPIECERLQNVPDNYTNGVSNTQRYKMLGNGWNVNTIKHIFSFIPMKWASHSTK